MGLPFPSGMAGVYGLLKLFSHCKMKQVNVSAEGCGTYIYCILSIKFFWLSNMNNAAYWACLAPLTCSHLCTCKGAIQKSHFRL